ncbi:MAG TPA: class I SAM-dependent methyltransferase [Ramlibacter sp.]|nr:class I SAM-dependent methyltransferase [Ramlibacter sp.]
MDHYSADTYGERIADVYDAWYATYDERCVEVLAGLARGGSALELGIGTGRIALPLRQRGVSVHGVDASPAMVARLRAKPGGAEIPVTMSTFADFVVDERFALVYLAFNTFFALLTQEEQIRCMETVARHLAPGGRFVIEAFVPDLTRFVSSQTLRVIGVEASEVRIDASQMDPALQQVTSQHIVLTESGVRLYPVTLRYAWPAEMDLMARIAGLRLEHRWADWERAPFGRDSTKHISVYQRSP